jgi:hypothetical protein
MFEESEKRHARIIEALKANPNARAVARELQDVSDTTIRRVARKHGISLKWGWGAANKDIILEELKKSPKVSVVAKKLGVSQPLVARVGKSAGIALAKKGGQRKLTPGQEAEVLRALRLNPNASAVARQIGGISYKSVSRYAKRANIKLSSTALREEHARGTCNDGANINGLQQSR